MMQQAENCWVCTGERPHLSETQRADALGDPTVLQLTVHVFKISMVEDEPLDVRDELPHQGLQGGARPVALRLRFGGHAPRESLHPADLQEQVSVALAERLLLQLA